MRQRRELPTQQHFATSAALNNRGGRRSLLYVMLSPEWCVRLERRANDQNEPNSPVGQGDLFLNPQAGSPAEHHQQPKRVTQFCKTNPIRLSRRPQALWGRPLFLTRKRFHLPTSSAAQFCKTNPFLPFPSPAQSLAPFPAPATHATSVIVGPTWRH